MATPPEMFQKLNEVGLMTKSTQKKLTAMQDAVLATSDLLQSDVIKNSSLIDEEVREDWEEEQEQRREEAARFLREVKAFRKMATEWEIERKRKDAARAKFDSDRAAEEQRRADREHNYMKIARDAQIGNYKPPVSRLAELNKTLQDNYSKRVQLTSRIGISEIQREKLLEDIATSLSVQQLRTLNAVESGQKAELTTHPEYGTHFSKVSDLNEQISTLEQQVRVAEETALNKETVQQTRRTLVEASPDAILDKCDSLVRLAISAKGGEDPPPASTEKDDPSSITECPSVASFKTTQLDSIDIPTVPSGCSVVLPDIIISSPLRSNSSQHCVLLSSDTAAVTLSGVLCQPFHSGTAVFNAVTIKSHESYSGMAVLGVTEVRPAGAPTVTRISVKIVPPETDFVLDVGDDNPGPEPGWVPAALSWKGKVVNEIVMDGTKVIVPPSGKFFAREHWSKIQSASPVPFWCDRSGVVVSRNPWEAYSFSYTKIPLFLGEVQHLLRVSPSGLLFFGTSPQVFGTASNLDTLQDTPAIVPPPSTHSQQHQFTSACMSESGEKTAFANKDSILVKTGDQVQKIDVLGVMKVVFHQNNKIIVATSGRVTVWEVEGGRITPLNVYDNSKTNVVDVCVRGDEVVIADGLGRLRVWLPPTITRDLQVGDVSKLIALSDLSVLTLTSSGLISHFEPMLKTPPRDIGLHCEASSIVSIGSSCAFVATSNLVSVVVWDVSIGCRVTSVLETHTSFCVLCSPGVTYFDIKLRVVVEQRESDRTHLKTVDLAPVVHPTQKHCSGLELLSPGRASQQAEGFELPQHVIDASSSTARCLGFLKANNLHPPTPCTQQVMRSFIIDFITDKKLTNEPYLDWWQLTPPT